MGQSLLKTLARKHKSTVRKMYRKYAGKTINRSGVARCLQVVVEREGKTPLVAQFGEISLGPEPFAEIKDLPLGRDRITSRNELIQRLLAGECGVCGSREDVQVHHIRKLADLNVGGRPERPRWAKLMAARRRKTLVLCRDCHNDVHAGRPVRSP